MVRKASRPSSSADGVLQCFGGGRARVPIDESEFAESLSGGKGHEDDGVALRGGQEDLHGPLGHEEK